MRLLNKRDVFKIWPDQRKQNTSIFYSTACSAWSIGHWEVFCFLDAMESIVNGINVDVVEKITEGLCAFHTAKAGVSSAPYPAFRQFKGNLIINNFDLASNLLIIRDSHIFPL